MNYHNIKHEDMLNGEGIRVTLFVSGCSHNCPGCHNPETHPVDSGIPFDDNALNEIYNELDKDYIAGITFSGGDPLNIHNRDTILKLCRDIKDKYPNKNIWLYTGYSYDYISSNYHQILNYIDVLVDGKFVRKLKDSNLKWCGSTNQRVIDIKKMRDNSVKHCIYLYED